MSEFETMCRIITKFPSRNEEGEDCYEIKKIRQGHVIYFATDDSYCWASLYFNSEGKFIGFSLN
jgi:hypothetical protein